MGSDMWMNYIRIAWRTLSQHKSYTFINLAGLAVGMACCILILLYVREELNFDTFHKSADRIVVVGANTSLFGRSLYSPLPLGDAMMEEIPAVEKVVRLNSTGLLSLSLEGQDFIEVEKGKFTDTEFFDIFSFELLQGNKAEALKEPNSIVLSKESSRQLFGSQNPVGQSLYWQQRDTLILLEVTGVIENEPQSSSIGYGALVSSKTMGIRDPNSWNDYLYHTFALLQSEEAILELSDPLQSLVEAHYEADENGKYSKEFFVMPLSELHLSELTQDKGFTGNAVYLYLFGSVALFILIIACVNYINLATARASLRTKEVGVRKVLGAVRAQVASQFIGESIILSMGAYLAGALAAILVLPFFNQLFGTSLDWQSNGIFLLWLGLISIIIGFVSGLYPSFYLSRFSPVAVLRNHRGQVGSGSLLRKFLVVAQFGIALVLIISSLIIYKQLQYVQTKDLGFESEQVVAVNIPSREAWNRRGIIRDKLAGHHGILEVSAASGSPGRFNIRTRNKPKEFSTEAKVEAEDNLTFARALIDYDFLDLLNIKLLAGRNFSRELERGFILNQKAAELLGWTPEEAIGKPFSMDGSDSPGKVIGIVDNFHINSLHKEIEGVVLQMHISNSWYAGGNILAKLAPDRISETIDFIENVIKPLSPYSTFNFDFLDERFDAMYRTERRLSRIITFFTAIAIIIACLGLYGLAAFSAERRTKEIGIRKVLGASIKDITVILNKDFLILVLIGFLIAVPIAWNIMNEWLRDFAYRIEIGAGIFLLAGASALLIALVTVSWQSVRAALANPIDSLRNE